MKARRVMVVALALSLMGGSVIFADAITQKIKMVFNGEEVSDGAIMIDGKTYLSVSQAGEKLNAIVEWDDSAKKVTVNKPNVHMLTFSGKDIFGVVKRGEFKFNVLCSVDNLKVAADAVKVSIIDPAGKVKDIQELDLKERKEYFMFQTQELTYDFKAAGKYTIAFFVKPSGGEYTRVAEKEITAI
ncbi:stalk domain-containing protein [Paenibacillus sp. GCM10027629]|uniref:stalk domain-containing protein n=1 Tax=Paenibacillus sp. GCM10027629 TaxID=3273414 RepID=UPI00362EA579